jgi:predicted alpha/beta hydrolase
VDGLVTVGGCLPYYRDFPDSGPRIVAMAALVIPLLTTTFGFLPRPGVGAPGARTLMRQWAWMALTGRTPYPSDSAVRTRSLVIALEGGRLAPRQAVEAFTRGMFARDSGTRWDYLNEHVPPEGASNDHIGWVRTPQIIVDRTIEAPLSGYPWMSTTGRPVPWSS